MRTLAANVTLSLDGFSAGPDRFDMSWLVPHALDDGCRARFAEIYAPATTALLGRTNFEGFHGFWTPIADDPAADPRDRAYATWQNSVDKIVFSTTLTEVPGPNARLATRSLTDEVADLREQDGGDILVLSSASIIRALLETDQLDVLHLLVVPAILGGGLTIWPSDVRTDWHLENVTTLASGATYQTHRRARV
ncbi:MAG: hypothetical protein ABS81_11210 [Pseudonocardia sp. SCN 72-86]|nr:MAG: hypothetical protein ABS81_11210 [Pseudonocardia sp. SCN 72-86]